MGKSEDIPSTSSGHCKGPSPIWRHRPIHPVLSEGAGETHLVGLRRATLNPVPPTKTVSDGAVGECGSSPRERWECQGTGLTTALLFHLLVLFM